MEWDLFLILTNIKSIFNKKSSILFSVLLIIITTIIIYYKILIQINIGPPWDTFDFLSNAMYFAGQGFGYTDLLRPPFLPFLTSLFFRAGFVSEVTIFAVDGGLYLLGVIGLYLFLKERFENLQSFIGALIFISFPVVILWIGSGYTDVASTSLSIWALYLTVLAVRKNPKFFYLSFTIAILAFLTRFSAAIIIFPMFLYLLINREQIKDFKHIVIGIILSVILLIPVFLFFYKTLGNPFLPFLEMFGGTISRNFAERFAFNSDPFYYFTNSIYSFINMDFLNSNSLWVVITFLLAEIFILYSVLMGIVIYLHKIIKSNKINLKNFKNLLKLKKSKINLLASILLLIIFIVTLNKINYLLSDVIFFLLSWIVYNSLKNEDLKFLDLDFLFLSWLTSYLIFNSVFQIKVCRYFIPMAPALAYFMILGWNEFSTKIKFRIKKYHFYSILNVLLVLILLTFTFSFIYQVDHDPISHGENFKVYPDKFLIKGKPYSGELYFETYKIQELLKVVIWLKDYDPEYKKKIIYSDYFWPHLSWYLKTSVKGIPDKKNKDVNSELVKEGADYYISINNKMNLKDYKEVSEFKTSFGVIIVYARDR
jgi:4-amino-4-deoxy-L-arabinose transferase-like glycosyltransferase